MAKCRQVLRKNQSVSNFLDNILFLFYSSSVTWLTKKGRFILVYPHFGVPPFWCTPKSSRCSMYPKIVNQISSAKVAQWLPLWRLWVRISAKTNIFFYNWEQNNWKYDDGGALSRTNQVIEELYQRPTFCFIPNLKVK